MRISFVVWCFAVATVEMLPSSAYAQVGWGGEGEEVAGRWMEGVAEARMSAVSADPDTPLGIGNQRTLGTLLQKKVGA